MKTVGEILSASASFLQNKNVDRARRQAEELLSFVLKMKRIDLYLQFDRPLIESELILMRQFVKRLSEGEPLDYVLGEVEFYGCKYKVDRRALIPRPETEILIDFIARGIGSAFGGLWDLCTGTGYIGIALKKKCPALSVSLSDLSSEALSLAAENALLNGVDVELLHGDLLIPFRGRKADIITVNPPYISVKEYFTLDPSVRNFEPKMALVGGEKGTEFFERLADDLPSFLNPKGKVFLEIGSTQGDEMQKIFSSPVWVKREVHMDWSGKARFFFLEMQ